jgi:LAS superfamily LD-carboxypeptidase LdcB
MSFFTQVIQNDARFTSTDCCRDLSLLEPVTRAAVQQLVADALALGITLQVSETYRSAERQEMLFNQKATQLKTVGVHHYGLACDFFKVIDGKASWAGDWAFLRDLAAKHGFISGLDWGVPNAKHTFIDPDHIQRIAVAHQPQLFAGTWYPDAPYNPRGTATS